MNKVRKAILAAIVGTVLTATIAYAAYTYYTLQVSWRVVAPITINPAKLDFGDCYPGETKQTNITITNLSQNTLNITIYSVYTLDWSLTANPNSFTLTPNQTKTVTITLHAGTKTGEYNVNITIAVEPICQIKITPEVKT